MRSARAPLERIAVVVPVRNEEQLLGSALVGIRAAMDRVEAHGRLRARLVVVLDDCTDGSAAIAAAAATADARISVASTGARRVGAARALGVSTALAEGEPSSLHCWWIANTDADTRVPPDWLERSADAADAGADALVGTVEPDSTELGPERFAAWQASHSTAEGHPHIHGANLGVRASAYLQAGGFQPVPCNEDVHLVDALRSQGAAVRSSGFPRVITSARLQGRLDHGFADYLSGLPDAGESPRGNGQGATQFVDIAGPRP